MGPQLLAGQRRRHGVVGDPTRYSAGTVTTQLMVTPVNDAPTVTGGPVGVAVPAVAEDAADPPGASVSSLFAGRFSDATDQVPDGSAANNFAGVVVTATAA